MIRNNKNIDKTAQQNMEAEFAWLEKRKTEINAKRAAFEQKIKARVEASKKTEVRLLELRKAVQMFLATLDADTQAAAMMEVPSVFPEYKGGKEYKAKAVFSYGVNGVGDPQLYKVLKAHTSADEWKPDATPSLYKKIGVTEDGIDEWVQPLCATDAYECGDVVSYNGTIYRSVLEGANVWSPDANPNAWEAVEDNA